MRTCFTALGFGSRFSHLLVVRPWTTLQLLRLRFQGVVVARLDEGLLGKSWNSAWHIVQLKMLAVMTFQGFSFGGRERVMD